MVTKVRYTLPKPLAKLIVSSFLYIRIQQNSRFYASALSREKTKSWKQSLDHYAEEAVKKLQEKKAVHLIDVEAEDDDMEGNDSSQEDEAKPPKKPILQLTEYVFFQFSLTD
jgi:hypothetical protein